MAKRKKKTTGRRRRRVSGLPGNFTPVLTAVGGAVLGKLASNFAKNSFGIDSEVAGIANIGIGAFLLPMLLKGPTGASLGIGMAAAGGLELATSFGISGVSDFYNLRTINGMKRVSGGAQQRLAAAGNQTLAGVALANNSASVRKYGNNNYNFATDRGQMQVVSGIPATVYSAMYD